MTKFIFSIKTKSGKTYEYEPSELKQLELSDLDKFSLKYSLFDLEEYFKSKLNIIDNIDKIVIANSRKKNIEYSLVRGNEYIKGVLDSLKIERINRENYTQDVVMINSNNSTYQEMRDYLFTNLEVNSDYFFKNVYTRDNYFSTLLKRYASICKQKELSLEDNIDKRNIMYDVEKELRIYSNFRGLAISREMSKYGVKQDKKSNKVYEQVVPSNVSYEDMKRSDTMVSSNSISSDAEYYEDYDVLTEDEVMMMAGEGNAVKGYRKRN